MQLRQVTQAGCDRALRRPSVLDLVEPAWPARRGLGWRRQAGINKADRSPLSCNMVLNFSPLASLRNSALTFSATGTRRCITTARTEIAAYQSPSGCRRAACVQLRIMIRPAGFSDPRSRTRRVVAGAIGASWSLPTNRLGLAKLRCLGRYPRRASKNRMRMVQIQKLRVKGSGRSRGSYAHWRHRLA